MGRHNLLLTYVTRYSKQPSSLLRHSANVYVTRLHGLSLTDYVKARSMFCKENHSQSLLCCVCEPMLKVAKLCTNNGHCKLSEAFKSAFPFLTYSPDVARRKFLQMPLACVRLSVDRKQLAWYLFEYRKGYDYEQLTNFVQTIRPQNPICMLDKSCVKGILSLAQTDRERELLRYSIFKASGLTSTAARKILGFEKMAERSSTVEEAISEVHSIHETIEELAAIKNKAFLHSLGIQSDSSEEDCSTESSDDDNEPITKWSLDSIPTNMLIDIAVSGGFGGVPRVPWNPPFVCCPPFYIIIIML